MDRNVNDKNRIRWNIVSLSARRAWIEMLMFCLFGCPGFVALRKESVDRNSKYHSKLIWVYVALRKESVDRNI